MTTTELAQQAREKAIAEVRDMSDNDMIMPLITCPGCGRPNVTPVELASLIERAKDMDDFYVLYAEILEEFGECR